jgi:deazaflavin-dependent oxidoreductase (nitroreductase family)
MNSRSRANRMGVKIHRAAYRLTSGRIGHHLADGADVLLLTTTGRRTARPHTTPLRYVRDCESWLVVPLEEAGAAPEWLRNIEEGSDVVVQVGGRRFAATAVIVDGDARAVLWWTVARRYPDLEALDGGGGEPLPVVVLRARSRDTADVPPADLLLGI